MIAPVEVLYLSDASLILTVHPSAAAEIRKELEGEDISIKQRFLNIFRVYSKKAALQHLYNVLEPLAADQASRKLLAAFEESDFDANLLQSGQTTVLNLHKVNTDFRINERVFRE